MLHLQIIKLRLQDLLFRICKLSDEEDLPTWWTNKVAVAVDNLDGMADYLDTQVEAVLERKMTAAEIDKREKIVLSLKKQKDDFKKRYGKDADAVMYATSTKKAMEGQVMSFEQMDKIYSGLKNAIDLYEKLVGNVEDDMADFHDDLGSDIVNYTKKGPLSSAPEIKNIENLNFINYLKYF